MISRASLAAVVILFATAASAQTNSPYSPQTDASASEIFERWLTLRQTLDADAISVKESKVLAVPGKRLPALTSRAEEALHEAADLSTEAKPDPDNVRATVRKLEQAEQEVLTLIAEIFERTRAEKPKPEDALPEGESLTSLEAPLGSVAWLGRDPQTNDAWHALVDLYFGGEEEQRRAVVLATELEQARRELMLVPFVSRGEEVEHRRAEARDAYARALASVRKEATGARRPEAASSVAESGTPTPQRNDEPAVISHLRETRILLQSSHAALQKLEDSDSRD